MSLVRIFGSLVLRYRSKALCTNNALRRQLLGDRICQTSVGPMSSFRFRSVDELKVEFNPKKHQFFIQLGKDKAVLEYRDVSPGVVDLFHTEVPITLREKGIAKLLAKEAFEHVVRNKMKMIVSCPYLQKYLNDNHKPEYLSVLYQSKD